MFRILLRVLVALFVLLLRRRFVRGPRGTGRAPAGLPPVDRSDVTDVPFTEIPPPPEAAPGSAGSP